MVASRAAICFISLKLITSFNIICFSPPNEFGNQPSIRNHGSMPSVFSVKKHSFLTMQFDRDSNGSLVFDKLTKQQARCNTAETETFVKVEGRRKEKKINGIKIEQSHKSTTGKIGKIDLQSVDFTTLLLISRELSQSLVPSRVENVFQLDSFNIAFGIKKLDGSEWLTISWHPQAARVHVGNPPPKGKEQESYSFSGQLRNVLRGLTLVGIELATQFDRVLVLSFSNRLMDEPTYRLYVEIMGSRSNVILIEVAGKNEIITCCAYQVSPTKSVRPIGVGRNYSPPPPLTARIPSLSESPDDFIEYLSRNPRISLKKALVSCYQGVSPMLAERMSSAVEKLNIEENIENIDSDIIHQLFLGPWQTWLHMVLDHSYSIANQDYWKSEGLSAYYPLSFAPKSTEQQDVPPQTPPTNPLSSLLNEYYGASQQGSSFYDLKKRCILRLSATLERLRSRLSEFRQQLDASGSDSILELINKGDLLTTYAQNWIPSEKSVCCIDFITGEEIMVPLSKKTAKSGEEFYLDPLKEAQLAYKTAKKLRRGAETIKNLLDQTQIQIEYAESVEISLEQLRPPPANDWDILRGIAEELGVGEKKSGKQNFFNLFGTKQVQMGEKDGINKSKKTKNLGKSSNKKPNAQVSSKGLFQLKTPKSGYTLIIGRNNLQNQQITFQMAKSHETWLHARGVPGSHVLLRCDPGQEISSEDLEFSANVAAYFSKSRNSSNVAVDVVSPKHLRKITGAGPGMVNFEKSKVIWGDPRKISSFFSDQEKKL